MAHSPGHYIVMPSSGKQSVTSCWGVITSGSQWLVSGLWRTGERLGKRVMLSSGSGRPVEHSLCGGEWGDTAPSCAFHMGASPLSKLLRVVKDTDQPATSFQCSIWPKSFDGDCVITVFQEMMQVIIRCSKTKMLWMGWCISCSFINY